MSKFKIILHIEDEIDAVNKNVAKGIFMQELDEEINSLDLENNKKYIKIIKL